MPRKRGRGQIGRWYRWGYSVFRSVKRGPVIVCEHEIIAYGDRREQRRFRRLRDRTVKTTLALFFLAVASLLAAPCDHTWKPDCEIGGHPAQLIYYPAWPVAAGDPPGALLIEGCVSCLWTASGQCQRIPPICVGSPSQCCPDRPAPITLRQWCQELAALPIPSGTPLGVPRPRLAVCDRALAQP